MCRAGSLLLATVLLAGCATSASTVARTGASSSPATPVIPAVSGA